MDNLRKLFRKLSQRYTTVAPPVLREDMGWEMGPWGMEPTRPDVRGLKAKEKPRVERFFNTGIPGKLDCYLAENGSLQLFGTSIQGTTLICTINERTLTASNPRANHLKTIFKEVAEREGLRLKWVEIEPSSRRGIKAAFWQFANLPPVDDTKLVEQTKPRGKLREPTLSVRMEAYNEMMMRGVSSQTWVTTNTNGLGQYWQ